VRAYGRARLALDRWLSDVVAAIEGFDRGLAEELEQHAGMIPAAAGPGWLRRPAAGLDASA
jgi:hypothetical protein